MTSLFGSSPA